MTGSPTSTTLRTQVTRLVLGVIALLALADGGTSLWLYSRSLEEQAKLKADAFASSIAADPQLRVAVWASYQAGVSTRLTAALQQHTPMMFAAVVDDKGALLGLERRTDGARTLAEDDARALASDAAGVPVPRWLAIASAAFEVDAGTAGAVDLGLGDDVDAGERAGNGAQRRAARVVVGFDRGDATPLLIQHALTSAVLGALAVLIALILVSRTFRDVFVRVGRVRSVAESLARGDLRFGTADARADEIGSVATSVDQVRSQWARIIANIRDVASAVIATSHEVRREAARVADGSAAQQAAASSTERRSREIATDSKRLAEVVQIVTAVSTETKASLATTRSNSQDTAQQMDVMLRTLRENDSHRAALASSEEAIEHALGALERAVTNAERPAAAVAEQMQRASETASVIAHSARASVSQSGEALELLSRARASNDAVADGTTETIRATQALIDSMADVLSTTALIRDIADMTSMLSLNASIIAAQAGERALGFGTVADEIRQLALRTRAAVDGIDRRTDDARRTLDEMARTVKGLSSTVQAARLTSEETTALLHQVLDAMSRTIVDVGGLAGLIVDASGGTRQSADAVGGIVGELSTIRSALSQQQRARSQLDRSALDMAGSAGKVRDKGKLQLSSTDALIERMTELLESAERLVKVSEAQIHSAQSIAHETARVRDVADEHRRATDAIGEAAARLDREAGALHETLTPFRL